MSSPLLKLATDHVLPNEPCFGLAEINRASRKAGEGVRRVQIVEVVRNDQVYVHERDLGLAEAFKTEPFAIPGHFEVSPGRYDVLETVGRLQGAAEEFRAKYDKPHERREAPQDFVKGFEEYATRRRDARVGRRQFAI